MANTSYKFILNDIQFPPDINITINGSKIIAESKILDGVAVFERVITEPLKIDIAFTCRQFENQPNKYLDAIGQNYSGEQILAQDVFENIFVSTFQPNRVLKIQNVFLNKIGVNEVIVQPISASLIPGSGKIFVQMTLIENYTSPNTQSRTLIVTT